MLPKIENTRSSFLLDTGKDNRSSVRIDTVAYSTEFGAWKPPPNGAIIKYRQSNVLCSV